MQHRWEWIAPFLFEISLSGKMPSEEISVLGLYPEVILPSPASFTHHAMTVTWAIRGSYPLWGSNFHDGIPAGLLITGAMFAEGNCYNMLQPVFAKTHINAAVLFLCIYVKMWLFMLQERTPPEKLLYLTGFLHCLTQVLKIKQCHVIDDK